MPYTKEPIYNNQESGEMLNFQTFDDKGITIFLESLMDETT